MIKVKVMENLRKKVSILIPCFNEEENVEPMSVAINNVFTQDLTQYDWELIFIDNDSHDRTREILRDICAKNPNIKAIFNAKNFGQFNSPYHGILQTTGDCVISMVCDFQDPIELIPQYLEEWEKGYKIVIGIKSQSKENKIVRLGRTIYYKMIKRFSTVEQIEHFTGSGLYDRSFIEVLRDLNDPTPFLRGIVGELGFRRKEIEYVQPKRRAGKTHNNFYSLYDAAMLSFTSYTKIAIRLATFVGLLMCFLGGLGVIAALILRYAAGIALGWWPIVIALDIFSGIQLTFTGLIGEYISTVNSKVMRRPLVVEEERINF